MGGGPCNLRGDTLRGNADVPPRQRTGRTENGCAILPAQKEQATCFSITTYLPESLFHWPLGPSYKPCLSPEWRHVFKDGPQRRAQGPQGLPKSVWAAQPFQRPPTQMRNPPQAEPAPHVSSQLRTRGRGADSEPHPEAQQAPSTPSPLACLVWQALLSKALTKGGMPPGHFLLADGGGVTGS